MTRRRRLGWALAIEYGILLALGLGVGILFGRRLARRNEIGDGPMVTPIYELPKVGYSSFRKAWLIAAAVISAP